MRKRGNWVGQVCYPSSVTQLQLEAPPASPVAALIFIKSLVPSQLQGKAGRLSDLTTQTDTWEAKALLNLGSAYFALDQKEQASSYLLKALQMAKDAKDRRSHGRTLYNLALITARLGRWEGAADLMAQALQWYQDHEEVYARAERTVARYNGLSFLSSAHKRLNDSENAQHNMGELRDLAAQDPKGLAAYLADPHVNFFKWKNFRDRKNEGVSRF